VKGSPRWFGVGRSETGLVRPSNQDSFAAINTKLVWVVADGMGGHPAGDLAAHTAVQVVTEQARSQPVAERNHPHAALEFLTTAIIAANQAIHERTQADPALKGMGTTIVAMAIVTKPTASAHVGYLGDSRAYRYHRGALVQLTRDHTMVERFVQRGLLHAEEAKSHPERHVLTKGLGLGLGLKPSLISTPIEEGDLLLLCSDGLTKMLSDDDIAAVLSRAKNDPRRACHDLVEESLMEGGEDNVTVIVCAYTVPTKAEV